MELFTKIINRFQPLSRKKLHLNCLTGFWIHFWNSLFHITCWNPITELLFLVCSKSSLPVIRICGKIQAIRQIQFREVMNWIDRQHCLKYRFALGRRELFWFYIQWTLSISNSQGTNKFVRDRESSRQRKLP